jgi:TusA-related sulfurtransferase
LKNVAPAPSPANGPPGVGSTKKLCRTYDILLENVGMDNSLKSRELDCRGQACPQPVLKTKEIVDRGEVLRLTVLVDNEAAKENVSRFLERSGFVVRVDFRGGDLAVTGTREEEVPGLEGPEVLEEAELRKILVLVGADRLGRVTTLWGKSSSSVSSAP